MPQEHLPADWQLPVNTEQDWFVDTTRIRQELGYSEIVPLDQALRQTIDWQRSHPPQEPQQFTAPGLLDYATENPILTLETSALGKRHNSHQSTTEKQGAFIKKDNPSHRQPTRLPS